MNVYISEFDDLNKIAKLCDEFGEHETYEKLKAVLTESIVKYITKLEEVDFKDIEINNIPINDYFGLISFEYYKYIKRHEPKYTKFEYILYLLDLSNKKKFDRYLYHVIESLK